MEYMAVIEGTLSWDYHPTEESAMSAILAARDSVNSEFNEPLFNEDESFVVKIVRDMEDEADWTS